MNKLKTTILVLLIVLVGHSAAQGQSDLDQLADRIKRTVEAAEPGWKCERGQPFEPPGQAAQPQLLIEVCDLRATVTGHYPTPTEVVVRHVLIYAYAERSAEEARRIVQHSINDPLNRYRRYQPLKDLGDEAYTFGIYNADILMRSGRFVFDFSTIAHVELDPDGLTLNSHDTAEREKAEQLRITPLFARHVLDASQ
jgi:hypothetical protein